MFWRFLRWLGVYKTNDRSRRCFLCRAESFRDTIDKPEPYGHGHDKVEAFVEQCKRPDCVWCSELSYDRHKRSDL